MAAREADAANQLMFLPTWIHVHVHVHVYVDVGRWVGGGCTAMRSVADAANQLMLLGWVRVGGWVGGCTAVRVAKLTLTFT